MTAPSTRDEFFQALRENRERPRGRATVAIAEELVEAAEAFGDPEVTVSALVELMRGYHGSGEVVKYPVAFARLLGLWDEHPKAFDESEVHRLFWYFKWVGSGLLSTPDVPLASIRGWIAEMRRRYRAQGHDLQPVHAQEYALARHLGEGEQLAYELWATRGRTQLSDCAACEARTRAAHHIRHGDDRQALAELQPTFDGQVGCDEEPHNSQALALLPLLRLGRLDEARAAHLTGYRKVRGQEAELSSVGRHLEFCALTGNEARGLELLAQNRGLFDFTAAPSSRLDFLTGVQLLLARLVGTGHGHLPCAGPLGTAWTVAALHDTVAGQADALAARFDARNGNGTVSGRRRERLAVRPLHAQLNLGVQTSALADRPAAVRAGQSAPPVAEAPQDFAELVAEVRRLDRDGDPRARALWDALLKRAEAEDVAVDELLRAEIASELAQRAAKADDWDACAARLREAVDHYTRAGRTARRIGAASKLAWCEATRDDLPPAAAIAAVEAAWPVLEGLLAEIQALIAADFATEEERTEALVRRLVVRQSRILTARQAQFRAGGADRQAHWVKVFTAEAQALIAEGRCTDRAVQVSLAHEVLAEFQSAHGEPVEGEASARRAIEIFTERGWEWRLPRGRLLLALALSTQGRHPEALAELEQGLAQAPSYLEPGELTPLHRMLGSTAMRAEQYPTAVRAFSEAAARLDREGERLQARETRWHLSRVLLAQGSVADAVAVLETLLDPTPTPAPTPAPAAVDGTGGATSDGPQVPSAAEQLTAQIRVDLANALLTLGEPRDAAREFLHLAEAVSRWPEKGALTSAAAGAAGALAQAGNWEGARAALERALASNAEAPCLPDLTDTLRTLALQAVEARGAEAAEEALGYLDRADRLREEFPQAAREQFVSVDVDVAQCCTARGQVHATTGRPEQALAAFEQAIACYDEGGYPAVRPRFEAVRMAALVEGRGLDRAPAARERLDKAAAEADAAGLADAAATLRRVRDGLR
ncbi:hypothetical protein GXW83_22090 [Streptacidiphilus sp. PB12-B1b]|uniref:hypothetical protein n=1 Tax=Streptacidiphilus sp. PB12-B1b TaxID=2705012 RepID=UPI0015FB214A|nr:hypothetical protein [Streptacidiphilus sp. PB12-B1b]QMU77984.1 hypothetical protein GXW83_22090 [Streptacidiphilus sp. PB12-B1b]